MSGRSARSALQRSGADLPLRVGAALLAGTIFCLDAFTRDDLAVAGLYVLVPLIAASAGGASRRAIRGWSLACAGLAVTGYLIFRARGAPQLALAHLGISLTVLLVTTILLLRTKAMNAAAIGSERRYRTIFDTLAVSIWEHDFTQVAAGIARLRAGGVSDLRRYLADHPEFVVEMRRRVRITDVNATALSMMGVASKSAFFSRLSDFLPESDESFAECILAIDERRPIFQSEATVLPLDGTPRQIIVAFGLGPEASLDRVPGSVLDISARKELEAQVLRTREDLALAQRTSALAAMSASIAHEINQPMSAIQSYADAARRWMTRTPPNLTETSAALAGLTEAVGHARVVMNRVRSLVGTAGIETAELELNDLLSTTMTLMRSDAAAAQTRLVQAGGTPGELRLTGDRILLKQVFVNLITNAIQAMADTPPAQRLVTMTVEERDGEAIVTVADRGHGWGEATEARLFGSFYTTKPDGMGLGLSISRNAIERHGGTIALGAREHGGAVVTVTLPLIAGAPGESGMERRLDQVAL